MAIVHHRDSHRNLAWRPIPLPRQTGLPGGGGGATGPVRCWKKAQGGIMGKESAALPKRPCTVHRTTRTTRRISPDHWQWQLLHSND